MDWSEWWKNRQRCSTAMRYPQPGSSIVCELDGFRFEGEFRKWSEVKFVVLWVQDLFTTDRFQMTFQFETESEDHYLSLHEDLPGYREFYACLTNLYPVISEVTGDLLRQAFTTRRVLVNCTLGSWRNLDDDE